MGNSLLILSIELSILATVLGFKILAVKIQTRKLTVYRRDLLAGLLIGIGLLGMYSTVSADQYNPPSSTNYGAATGYNCKPPFSNTLCNIPGSANSSIVCTADHLTSCSIFSNAEGFASGGPLCSFSAGDRVATGFGIVVTPTHDGKFIINGVQGFYTSVNSQQPINYFVYQSSNATIPKCDEIIDFSHKPNDFAVCSFVTEVPGATSFNEVSYPLACTNQFNQLPAVGKPVTFYFVMMIGAGGGLTLTTPGDDESIVVQEF